MAKPNLEQRLAQLRQKLQAKFNLHPDPEDPDKTEVPDSLSVGDRVRTCGGADIIGRLLRTEERWVILQDEKTGKILRRRRGNVHFFPTIEELYERAFVNRGDPNAGHYYDPDPE